MKVCIFGAGAVGGHIATRLINAGADEISIVARGAMLKAIRERGITLRSNGKEEIHVKPKSATDDPSTLPPQDVVLVTVKAYALGAAAPAIAKLLAPNGIAVFLLNGIPWWFQHGFKGATGTLPLLDPDGALWRDMFRRAVVSSFNQITVDGDTSTNDCGALLFVCVPLWQVCL